MPAARCVVACAFIAASGLARADTVTLDNGDRIGGKVTHLGSGVLTLETDFAGTARIPWRRVIAIETDGPVQVLREGESTSESVVLTSEYPSIPLESIAYINPTPDESGNGVSYRARINVSGARTTGNTNTTRGYVEGELTGRAKAYRYIVGGKARRETDTGTDTASGWLLNGKRDHFLENEKRFVYVRSSFERDRFKDIELRSALGTGYGSQFIDTDATKLSGGVGLDAVWVNRIADADQRYPAFGWDARFSHQLWTGKVELFHDEEGYWNLKDTEQVTLRTRTGIRAPIAKGLNANAALNVDWERRPAPGRKPLDAALLVGLSYDW